MFVYFQDSRIAVKACEGLMLCASLPEEHAATVIILYTPFCEVMVSTLEKLSWNTYHKSCCLIRSVLHNAHCFLTLQADRLKVLFDALPKNMEPLDISAVAAKWGYAKQHCLFLIRKAALVHF